uniref:nicotinate phosphoribosyltransferase n=1 Tax=Angiostrongylus cantonensis TaxID=6313 RepID=A0A158PAA2_ANGCA
MNAYLAFTMTLGDLPMYRASAAIFMDKSATNLPTPEEWWAWWAMGTGIDRMCIEGRLRPLRHARPIFLLYVCIFCLFYIYSANASVQVCSVICIRNASRFGAAGDKLQMLEFRLRRARRPNGSISASKYCYIGGLYFDGTSNLLTGKLFGIPVKGTHAHSFIRSFSSVDDLKFRDGSVAWDLYSLSKEKTHFLKTSILQDEWDVLGSEVNDGEVATFVACAIVFPNSLKHLISLLSSIFTCRSEVINFISVTWVLFVLEYRSVGSRIDGGDLAYLSKEVRRDVILRWIEILTIVQPALDVYFYLVVLSGHPIIKLNQEMSKITIPGLKKSFRLHGKSDKQDPVCNKLILCRHPFEVSSQNAYIRCMYIFYHLKACNSYFLKIERVNASWKTLREGHRRYLNPTPYEVVIFLSKSPRLHISTLCSGFYLGDLE